MHSGRHWTTSTSSWHTSRWVTRVCCPSLISSSSSPATFTSLKSVASSSRLFLLSTPTQPFTALLRDHPGEPVPEENFWTFWCKGRLTQADTLTIRLGATPSGLTSAHLHHPPHIFLRAGCPSCHPTNSVKALKATRTFGLGRRC